MPLGVLNNISAVYAENNLNQTQSSLQNVLTQLSSGSKINSGADDPAGLSIANGLAANSAALSQSSSNASEGAGFLQVADGALSQVTSLLTSAVTLATEAGGGTLSSSQLGAANQEYQDILTQIGTIGSTTEYNELRFSAATRPPAHWDGARTRQDRCPRSRDRRRPLPLVRSWRAARPMQRRRYRPRPTAHLR
jgi:flagellin